MFGLGHSAVWGVDIGDYALKAVKMVRQGNALVLQDFQITRYSELAVEGQQTRREDLVFQALMRLFQPPEMQTATFIASIPSQNVFSRFVGLPPVDRRRVPEIVRFEARQQIPFDLSEVIWDYQLVRPDFVPGAEIEIGLFAVKREVINSFLGQFVMAQDRLEGVQIPPLAIYNLIRRENEGGKPVVVIDIGAQSTDLLIVEDTKFWLRNLPIAGNSFNAIIAKKFNIAPEEAEKVKEGLAESKHRRKVFEAMQPVLKDLVAEIQRSIGYYKSLARNVKFEDVILLGDGFRVHGLQRFLTDQLQYRVRPLAELTTIAYGGPEDKAEELAARLPSLAVATGLAIQGLGEGEATVDLLPEEFTLRRELKRKRPSAIAVAILVWVSVLFLFLGEKMAIGRVSNFSYREPVRTAQGSTEMRTVNKEFIDQVIKRAKDLASKASQAESQVGSRLATLQKFAALGELRDYWSQVLSGLTEAIPQEKPVYVEDLVLQGVASRGGGGGGGGDGPEGGGGRSGRSGRSAPGAPAFVFVAYCDERYGERHLKKTLREALLAARVYPERVKLFKDVTITSVNIRETKRTGPSASPAAGEGTSGAEPGAGAGDGASGSGGMGGRASGGFGFGHSRMELHATVTAILNSRKDVANAIEKARREAAAKRARTAPSRPGS